MKCVIWKVGEQIRFINQYHCMLYLILQSWEETSNKNAGYKSFIINRKFNLCQQLLKGQISQCQWFLWSFIKLMMYLNYSKLVGHSLNREGELDQVISLVIHVKYRILHKLCPSQFFNNCVKLWHLAIFHLALIYHCFKTSAKLLW